MKRKNYLVLLAIILIIGAGLRLYKLESKSFWYDESKHLKRAAHYSVTKIAFSKPYHAHPPLYFLVLKAWIKMLGESIFAARLFSVLMGILSLFIIFKVGEILYDKKVALLSSLFLCLSPMHMFYSQEAGNYPLFILLALLLIYTVLKLFKTNNIKWYLYFSICLLLLIMTHYYSIFLLLSLNLFFVFQLKKYKSVVLKLFLIQAIVSFFLLPLLVIAGKNLLASGFISLSWIERMSFWKAIITMFETFSYGGSGYGGNAISIPPQNLMISRFLFFIYTISIIYTLYIIPRKIAKDKRQEEAKNTFFLLVWLLGGLLLSHITSYLAMPIFMVRYVIYALPAFYILGAKGVFFLKNKSYKFIVVLLIAILNACTLAYYYNNELNVPWKKVACYLRYRGLNKNDLILFEPYFQADVFYYNDCLLRRTKNNTPKLLDLCISFEAFKQLVSEKPSASIKLLDKSDTTIYENKRVFLIQSWWAGAQFKPALSFLKTQVKTREVSEEYFSPAPNKVREYFNAVCRKGDEVSFDYAGKMHIINNFETVFSKERGVYIGEFYISRNSLNDSVLP